MEGTVWTPELTFHVTVDTLYLDPDQQPAKLQETGISQLQDATKVKKNNIWMNLSFKFLSHTI